MTLNALVMTKEALIERLQEQMPAMRARDEKVMAEHRKEEQAALKAFKAALRDMLKWDYETARDNNFQMSWRQRDQFKPSCPMLLAPRVERTLELLAVDRRKRYSLAADGSMSSLYALVTWTENPIDLSGGCK